MVRRLTTAGPVASFKKNEQRSKSRDETIGVVRTALHPNSISDFACVSKRAEPTRRCNGATDVATCDARLSHRSGDHRQNSAPHMRLGLDRGVFLAAITPAVRPPSQ
jgi:hypothetical protein